MWKLVLKSWIKMYGKNMERKNCFIISRSWYFYYKNRNDEDRKEKMFCYFIKKVVWVVLNIKCLWRNKRFMLYFCINYIKIFFCWSWWMCSF